jgi:uncharacterized repeat protein (TIGR01451 family)
MKNGNRKSAGGKPLCTKLGMIAVISALVLVAVAPMAAGEWYFKPGYPNYAPSGMPDFDQQQDAWQAINAGPNGVVDSIAIGDDVQISPTGTPVGPYRKVIAPGPNCALESAPVNDDQLVWVFCGPTAVANCFWWFDSKYADPAGTSGDGNDMFPLVRDYGVGDDHLAANVPPLVCDLANRMLTCSSGTTNVHDMEYAIAGWLNETGLNNKLYEHTVEKPDFYWIEEEIERSQDVILLLGFWAESGGEFHRCGGHYVTCAGVNSEEQMIAFSDPFFDNAVFGGPGHTYPVPHPVNYPPEFHNNAANMSHDFYNVSSPSPSPGGNWSIPDYPVSLDPTLVKYFQEDECWDGPIHTEIEYAVVISPKCEPAIEVNKTVWDPDLGKWVKKIDDAQVYENYTFRCEIHNNGTCCNLTDIRFWDNMSCSMEYADNASLRAPDGEWLDIVLPGNFVFKPKILHPENQYWNPYDPICNMFEELCPEPDRRYHLISWEDTNGDDKLSYCDQIEMGTKVVDQQQVEWTPYDALQNTSLMDYQSFVPAVPTLDAVQVALWGNGGSVTVTIYDPSMAAIGSSTLSLGPLGDPSTPVWVQFHFTPPVDLMPDQTYYIDVTTDGDYHWFFIDYDNYPPGQLWLDGILYDMRDWTFKTEYYSSMDWYHVELLPYTLTLTDAETGDISYFDSVLDHQEIDLQDPSGTQWKKVCCCKDGYLLLDWMDANWNGILDSGDDILLRNIRTGETVVYHVEEVTIDLVVNKEWLIDDWLPGLILEPCQNVTIEFDAQVVKCGNDTNIQYAKGWCEQAGWVYGDEDIVWINTTPKPGIEVNKTVWNGTAWVNRIDANISDIVRFNSTVHNNGTCCNLTNMAIMDTLSESLQYVNATPNPDNVIHNPDGTTTLVWNVAGPLVPCQTLIFLIDANVTQYGEDWNKQNATAETCFGTIIYDEDYAYVNVPTAEKPDLVITDAWVCWPDNCTICYNVTNLGNGTAPACHSTALYHTWTYTQEKDNITVCADNNETVAESDEGNNCLTDIWVCGDATGDGIVTMADGRRIYMHKIYGTPLNCDPWEADVTGDGLITMADGRRIYMHKIYGTPLNCKVCTV